MIKNSRNRRLLKKLPKKIFLFVITLTIFLQNFQSISALALMRITPLENKVGPYYNQDVNRIFNSNELLSQEYGQGLSNLSQFTYNNEDVFENEESSFVYEESLNENTTIYVSEEDPNLKKMEISSEQVNYLDDNNEYQPIGTNIEESNNNQESIAEEEYPFNNETNTIKSYYGLNLEKNGIIFITNGLELSYKPILNEVKEEAIDASEPIEETGIQEEIVTNEEISNETLVENENQEELSEAISVEENNITLENVSNTILDENIIADETANDELIVAEAVNEDEVLENQENEVQTEYVVEDTATETSEIIQIENPSIYSNQIIYPLSNEVNIRYTINNGSVKEDIILNTIGNTNSFKYELNTNGRIELSNNNLFIFNSDNKLSLILNAPKAYDASGNETDITLALEGNVLTYTLDYEWLNSNERVYPIIIDPSVSVMGHQAYDVSIIQSQPYMTVGNVDLEPLDWKLNDIFEARLYIGNDPDYGDSYSIYRLTEEITNQLRGKYIKNASTHFTVESASSSGKVNACPVKKDIDINGINYSNVGNTNDLLDLNSCVEASYNTNDGITIDSTNYVKNITENNVPNGGLFLMLQDQNAKWLRLYASEYFNYELAHQGSATSGYYPGTVIEYYDNPDISISNLNDFTYNLRPFVKYNYEEGVARFVALGVDGKAPYLSNVYLTIKDGKTVFHSQTMEAFDNFFHYPNYPEIKDVPNKWTTLESNYQVNNFIDNLETNKIYDLEIYAQKGNNKSEIKKTWFLVYESKKFDLLSNIANYYGVSIETIKEDNNLQDELITEDNLLFIREPKLHKGDEYPSKDLSQSEKAQIDAYLRGRGLQCEFGNEPINFNTGNFLIESDDLALQVEKETFYFSRTYNSKAANDYSINGYGWSNNLLSYIGISKNGAQVLLPDSKVLYFTENSDGSYSNTITDQYELTYLNNHFSLLDKDENTRYDFLHTGELSSITSHNNRITKFEYNSNRQLIKVILPNSLTLDFSYSNGLLTKISLSDGTSVSYQYDQSDNLISFADQEGKTIKYNYDNKHRITSWINRNNETVITNTYDNQNRVIKQIDYLGNEYNTEYNDNQTINTDPLGNKTIYNYDDYGATTSIIYSDNNEVRKTYTNNLLTYEKTESGLVFNYTYNNNRDLIKKERSDGFIEEWVYDDHNVTYYSNSEGQSLSFTYDFNNNETSRTDSLGNTSYKTYDSNSNLLSETDFNGNTTSYSYDDKNQLSKATYPDGSYYTYTYDIDGYLANTTDKYGNTTYLVHNNRNELVLVTNTDGSTIKYEYDNNGNQVAIENENGFITRNTYDIYGNLLSSTDPKGNTTSYEYDSNNNLIKTTYPDGSFILNTYDSRNRLVSSLNNTHLTTYSYNDYGIETITNEKNQVKTYEYDELGNIIKTTDFDGLEILSEYDKLSRLIKTTDSKGISTTYEYDLLDRLVKEVNPLATLTYEYDNNSNLIQTTYESQDSTRINKSIYNSMNKVIEEIDPLNNSIQYEYDGSRLISLTDKNGNTTTYAYDSRENVVKETLSDGASRSWIYDNVGNKISETDTNGNTTSFIYDPNNNPIQIVDKENQATNYSYDPMNRQIESVSPLGYKESYTYDLDSNIVTKSINDRLVESYTYDKFGSCISETINNLTTTYEYDEHDEVIKKINPYGLVSEFEYDKYHRLIKSTTNNETSSIFTYDDYDNVLSETDLYGEVRINQYNSDLNLIETTYHNLTSKYEYDLLNRKIKEEDSLGNIKETKYDNNSNIIEESINGNTSYYEYDGDNNLIKETNTLGYITENSHDHEGNLLSIIDGNSNKTTFTYNKNYLPLSTSINGVLISSKEYNKDSLLIKEIDGEGYNNQYLYDSFRNLIKSVDKKGYSTEYTYDEYFNLITTTNPLGYKTTNIYNELNQLIETKDPQNNSYKYKYDIFNNLVKTTNPLGANYESIYNSKNQLEKTIDERGLETQYSYNSYNDILTIEKDGITSTTNTYDSYGRLLSRANSLGNKESYTYDKEGNILSILYPNGAKESFKYNTEKQVISQTDVLGVTTIFEYDGVGNNITKTIDNSRVIKNEYDDRGNAISLIDANNNKTEFIYNNRNELIETIDSLGYSVKTEYSPTGQVISTIDQNGNTSKNVYDELDRLIQTIDNEGNITTNTYDSLNNLISAQNPRGYRVNYEYNSLGSLTKEMAGDKEVTYKYNKANDLIEVKANKSKKESYSYDKKGNVLEYTKKDGSKINYTYDSEDNILTKNSVTYSYDNMGSLVKMVDSSGTSEFTYNLVGSLTSTNQNDSTVKYQYNKYNELEKIIYPDNSTVSYSYDNNSNLIETKNKNLSVQYEYDQLNRETKQVRSNGVTTLTSYDKIGNISHIKTTSNGTSYFEASYSYNKNNSLIKEEINQLGNRIYKTYTYNENDELISSVVNKDSKTTKTDYVLTLDGNVSEVKDGKVNTFNEFNELDQIVKSIHDGYTFTYVYDDNGNRIKETRSDGRVREYTYNEFNNLVKVKDFDDIVYTYTYDGLDHRLSMFVHKEGHHYETGSYQVEDKMNKLIKRLHTAKTEGNICLIPYYNEEDFNSEETKQDIEEKLSEAGNSFNYYTYHNSEYSTYHTNYFEYRVEDIYETEIKYINDYTYDNEVVLTEIQDNNYNNYLFGNNRISSNKVNYISDYSNTVVMTLNPKGDINTEYEYTDYGLRDITYDPFNNNTDPIGFNGEYHDPDNLVYLRARYYDPSSFSFISEDPYRGVLYDPSSRNRYSYARNNPKKYGDSSGHWPQWLNNVVNKVKTVVTNTYNNVKTYVATKTQPIREVVNKYVVQPAKTFISNTKAAITANYNKAVNYVSNWTSSSVNNSYILYKASAATSIGRSVSAASLNKAPSTAKVSYINSSGKAITVDAAHAKAQTTQAKQSLSKLVSSVGLAARHATTSISKININKVNIQSKIATLSSAFPVVSGALANRLKGLCETIRSKNIELTSSNGVKDATTHSRSGGCPTFANCLVSVSNDGLGLVQVYKQGETSDVNDGGSGNYIKYDREGAVEYALRWTAGANAISLKSILEPGSTAYYIYDGLISEMNPKYRWYRTNCANFVSQSLVSGGLEMNDEWYMIRENNTVLSPYIDLHFGAIPLVQNYIYDYDVGEPWRLADEQFEYFSDIDNGYTSKSVIEIKDDDDLLQTIEYDNIRIGDLIYFEEKKNPGISHAAIITNVDKENIYYSGKSVDRQNQPVSDSIREYNLYLIQMNDYFLGGQ